MTTRDVPRMAQEEFCLSVILNCMGQKVVKNRVFSNICQGSCSAIINAIVQSCHFVVCFYMFRSCVSPGDVFQMEPSRAIHFHNSKRSYTNCIFIVCLATFGGTSMQAMSPLRQPRALHFSSC